ncbi:7TM diverse intracellular signaling domain-containing protein [uncultured Ramlibacter sp.]|uniref:sensor domain-containing diguanylate cyclase n=1 Tax=uncultured Ramlibacter sp. TaxID=260755 RepID=UPI0026276A23|nr:7TM diverse intracellular signaling domain-containing protein [uncultured Ramlibacter sp.]
MGFRGGRRLLWAMVLMLAAVLAAPAVARTVLDLDPELQPVALLDWGDAWTDESGRASAATVAADPAIRWAPTRADAIYPLTTGKALWIRFTVPPAPDNERWYLEIPYPSVNLVSLYTPDPLGNWVHQSAGDSLPVAGWPVPHRHPLLPIAVSAENPRSYLLRVENPHSFSAPLSFVSESYFSRREQRTSLILGIYFGLAGLAAVLALLSAVSLRDNAYGHYALAVTTMALTQASMTGIAGLHLWPGLPRWNDVSSLVLPVLTTASFVWFLSAVVSMPERSPRLHRAMATLSLLGLPVAVAICLVEPALRYRLQVPYAASGALAGIVTLLWAARRGDRYALWLLAAFTPVVVGAVFPLARTWGLIPVSFWTQHGMQVGIAIELPLILVILMLRSQARRENNRRIQGLDRLDPATGLINAQVFGERLGRMIARSQRLRHQSAVLLVDIVNIGQIRRDFDRRSAEEMPLRVAGRLLSAAREIDSVARLSDTRFGMLVEGPLTPEDAASAGPRVVARCLMPFKGKPLEWVAQVRVAQTLVPLDGSDPQSVVERLETLLASVPSDSRRAVFTLK